jgi:hypothetical protein
MFETVSSEAVALNVSFPDLRHIEVAFESDLLEQIWILGRQPLIQEISMNAKLACALDDEPVSTSGFSLPNGETQRVEFRSQHAEGKMRIFVRSLDSL